MEGKLFLYSNATPPPMSQVAATTFTFDLQRFDLTDTAGDDSVFSVTTAEGTKYGTASEFTTTNLSGATNITVLKNFEMTSAVDISTSATLALGTNRITANVTGTQPTDSTSYTTAAKGIFYIKNGATLTVTANEGTTDSVGGVTLSEDTTGKNKINRIFLLETNGSISLNGGFYDTSKAYSNTITDAAGIVWYNASSNVSDYTKDENSHSYKLNNPGSITMTNVNASVAEASFALWIPEMLDNEDISGFDSGYWANFCHTINVSGGSYKVSAGDIIPKSRGMFCVGGDSVVIDSVTIENDYNPGIYVFNNSEATVKGDTTVNITGTLAEAGSSSSKYTGGGYGVNAIATSSNSTLNVEGGIYTSNGYVAYVYSSGGTFNFAGDATFNQGTATTPLLAYSFDENAYSGFYNDDNGKSILNVSSGTFNLAENGVFISNKLGNAKYYSAVVTGGRFSANISEFVANEDFTYQTSTPVGDYYYVGTKGNNWNPVSKDATDNTKAAATNTTWHYFSSSTATSPVATLEGSGSTLTLTTATGVPETFAISLKDLLEGNTNGYKALNASDATVDLAIDATSTNINQIKGGSHDDTLTAGSASSTLDGDFGDDLLVGGDKADTFIYNAGADTVSGYGEGDLVVLEDFKAGDANFTADSSNISLNFGGGDLLVFEDVGENAISVQSGNDNYVYTKNYVALNDTSVTLAANYSSVPEGGVNTFDASETEFETIDASPVTTANGVYVIGNALDNKIFGGTAGGTLYGNAGNDLLDVNDRNADSKFTFQYTAGKDSIDGFAEDNDKLTIESALRANITGAKSSSSKLVFNFSDKANVLTFKGDDIEKVSLQGGGFLTKNGVVTIPGDDAINSLELFASAKGRIDLTDTPYSGTDIKSVNAEKANKQSITLVGGSVGGAFTFANNKKKDLFEYTGGDVTISNYEAGKDRINLGNYSINGFQIANTNDVSLNLSNGEIMSVVGAAQSEVLIHDANGKSNSYAKMVFAANGVLQNKAKRPTAATVSAGATGYEASNSIKKIYVTSGVSNIAITAGNNKTTLDASEADGVTLSGGAKNDKLIGNTAKADTFVYSAGKDIIEGYDSSDAISLSDTSLNIGDAKITLSKSSLKLKFSSKNTLTLKNSDLSTVKIGDASYTFGKNAYSEDGENVTLTNQFSGTYKIKDDDAGVIKSVDGSAVKKNLTFKGTSEAETFTGGTKKTTFKGGGGKDTLIGGDGKDIFFYAKGDTGTSEIQKFDFTTDKIKIANGTIKDISTQAGGIQFDMTSGKKGDTATAGSFLLASSIASGASAALDTSKVFIKANNTYYWFADKAGTGDNDKSYAAGDLITASTKVTRAQASTVGYEIIDLGYSTNLVKSTVAIKAGEFTFAKDSITKK